MIRHELKTDTAVFCAVLVGAKTHEIRRDDRGFTVGDDLLLRETMYTGAEMAAGAELLYTGRTALRTVSHIQTGYGLQEGWCILSFAPAPASFELPAMNDELMEILGRPNFHCRDIAARLRQLGQAIRHKAEHEQAAAIYFLLALYLKHGKGWREKAVEALKANEPGAPA